MTKAFKTGIDAPAVSVAGTAVSVDGHTHAGGSGAPTDATYVVTSANTTLTNERVLTQGSYLTITDNGSSTVTVAVDASTTANGKVVARDASGNFSAGTITAALTGNASTATTLQTARNINGTAFNGSADITVTAAAGTLTGTTLNSTVTASSLTSLGASPTVTTPALTLSTTTSTAEGRIAWDATNDQIEVGDGTTLAVFGKLGSATGAALGTASAGTAGTSARSDHVHPTTGVVPDTRTVAGTSPITVNGVSTTGQALSGNLTIAATAASTSAAGVVQLSDTTPQTSSVLAATPTAVKVAYDLANAAVPKSTVTTAGDLIVGTGSAAVTRLGIGANTHVLTSNGTTATWSAPTASSTLAGPVVVGSTQSSTTLGNNFALTSTATLLRFTGTANATLTGIAAAGPATPADGRMLYILNATTFTVTLSNASASSTAAYRMNLPGSTDVTLSAQEGITLVYDGTTSVWRAAYPFSVSGNAATATILQTSRNINGTAFNGSADITVTAAAGTLTGATLASGVTASSLTSFGTNATLTTPVITQATATPSFTTNTYTLASGDEGKMLLASNSTTAGNVKIPTNATTAFAVGTQIHIIQTGTGQLTISATTSGTTSVLSAGATAASPKLRAQYSAATMLKTATDTWYVFGDIA